MPVLMLLWWRRSLSESPRYLVSRGRLPGQPAHSVGLLLFGLTTAVLGVGVVCTVAFGLSTAGRSLEEVSRS